MIRTALIVAVALAIVLRLRPTCGQRRDRERGNQ